LVKVETAVNLSGAFLDGHIVNNKLTFTRLVNQEAEVPLNKEELNRFILELQQVYSTMIQNEKLNASTPQIRKKEKEQTGLTSRSSVTDKF